MKLVGLGFHQPLPDIDFETFSMAGNVWVPPSQKWNERYQRWDDVLGKWAPPHGVKQAKDRGLFAVGTAVYATHPSTEVLSMAYNLQDGRGDLVWIPGMPNPTDLFDYLASGGRIEAHNSSFEWWIWNHVCTTKYGWPELRQRSLRCSMAKARAFGLPGGLEPLGDVLGLSEKKDKRGKALLDKFSRPQNPTKKDPRTRHLMTEDVVDGQALIDYNVQDIRTEREASSMIPDLAGVEGEYWHLDQDINHRGVHIDLPSVRAAIEVIEQVREVYSAELAQLTGGIKPSEVAQLKKWVEDAGGIVMPNFDDEAIEDALGRLEEYGQDAAVCQETERAANIGNAIRALEIRQACSSASVNKVYAMANQAGPGDRLYGLFNYHAARTGRPTGEGPQPTNLPKAGPPLVLCNICGKYCGVKHRACAWCGMPFPPTIKAREWCAEMAEQAIQDIHKRDQAHLAHYYGDALKTVSGCLRGMFTAKPGYDLIASDFNAIEAVVIAQLAGEEWRLEVFRTHGKIYEMSASKVTNVSFEEMMQFKKDSGQHHPYRQKYGKPMELGCGFGGWVGALKAFGADEFLTDDEIKKAILGWRDASPNIVEFWGGQYRGMPWDRDVRPELYGLEGMAISALLRPGEWFEYRDIAYKYWQNVLYCRLPSGRCIHYQRPKLSQCIYMASTEAGKKAQLPAWSLTYEGWNTNPNNGPRGWININTYGGRLTENVVQAVARDYQRDAQMRLEAAGYPIVLHVYDENVAEVPKGWGSVEEFEAIMKQNPPWAPNWPINASGGWRGERYRKD